MLSDDTIIVHNFPDKKDIHIYVVADVHLGAREHMAKEWAAFRRMVLDDPNGYVVILGDLLDFVCRSSVGDTWDNILSPREQKDRMVKQLEPLARANRVLCLLPGNHERRGVRECEYNAAYDIAANLGITHLYRENMAFLVIRMGNPKGNGLQNPTYTLAVTHGAGGGKKFGGSLNSIVDWGYVIDGADIVIMGHTHKTCAAVPAKIRIDPYNGKVSLKPFKAIVATPWLAYAGYAARKMLPPSGHAPQVINLCGRRKEFTVTM